MRRLRRAATAAGILIVVTTLAGCVGGSPDAPERSASPSASPRSTERPTVRPTSAATDVATLPGSDPRATVVPDDNSGTRCDRRGDGYAVSGTVLNPEDASQDYRVYVSLIDVETVVQLGEVDVPKVRAGRAVAWAMTLPAGAGGLSCLVRIERVPTA